MLHHGLTVWSLETLIRGLTGNTVSMVASTAMQSPPAVLHVYLLTHAGQSSATRQPLVMNNVTSKIKIIA